MYRLCRLMMVETVQNYRIFCILIDVGIFESVLDEKSRQKAIKELNEDEKNRDGAVRTLREWVLQQQPWLTAPLGTRFLMKHLRWSKFSQLEARRKLENGLKIRTEFKAWSYNRDTRDNNFQDLLKTGFLLRLPRSDPEGHIFLLNRPGLLPIDDIKKGQYGGLDTAFRIMLSVLDWISMDERSQVNGVVGILDYKDFTFGKRSVLYTPTHVRQFINLFQDACCLRIKQLHVYNPGPYYQTALAISRPFFKQKIRDRIFVHDTSLVSLYSEIDRSVLPREYLPDEYTKEHSGTLDKILDYTIQGLTSEPVHDYIQKLSTEYRVDTSLKPDDNQEQASFRKLNVD